MVDPVVIKLLIEYFYTIKGILINKGINKGETDGFAPKYA